MKLINPTNLIVVLITMLFLCLSVPAISQQPVPDSLSYYRNVVDGPKDSETLLDAFRFFERHAKEAHQRDDLSTVAHDKLQLARINYKFGFYNESEILTIEALELLDVLPENSFVLDTKKSIYNLLGMLYRKNNYTEKALEFYDKALGYATNTFDSVTVFNNRSNTYKDLEKYQAAKEELSKSYDLLPRLKNVLRQALILDNMGYLNFKLGDTSALGLFNKALELRLKLKDKLSTFNSYQHLSEYYREQDKNKAMDYALKAYAISRAHNNPDYKVKALEMLADMDGQRYHTPYKTLKDSIDRAEQQVQNSFAALKYDVSKSELMAAREKAKRVRNQVLFLIALSISMVTMVWIRARAKKKRLLLIYATETRISKKVHDEIANDLYQVMSHIQTASKSSDALLDDLETIYNKTRDISKENSSIDMREGFDRILQDLLLSYKCPETTITTLNSDKVHWQKLSISKKHAIYRVLQELMTNMRKHSNASHVLVSFSQTRARIQIIYKDNGQGCDLRKQTGLQNAENRIKAINGTIIFDSEPQKGFQATIVL